MLNANVPVESPSYAPTFIYRERNTKTRISTGNPCSKMFSIIIITYIYSIIKPRTTVANSKQIQAQLTIKDVFIAHIELITLG